MQLRDRIRALSNRQYGTLFLSLANFLPMRSGTLIMTNYEKPHGVVDLLELKQLLSGLADNPRLNIGFRYRLSGQHWHNHFTRVLSMTDRGVTLVDYPSSIMLSIQDLLDIVQFEIDYRFHHYQPHFHYDVRPLSAVTSGY